MKLWENYPKKSHILGTLIPKPEQEIFGQITIDISTLVKKQFHYTENNLRPYITP